MTIAALITIREVCIPRGAARNFTLIAEDVTFDDNNKVTSKVATDLTGGTVFWLLRNPDTGEVIAELNSVTISQIEILADQSFGSADRGRSILKLTGAITNISPGRYTHEAWVELPDGRRDTIIDKSPFIITDVDIEFPVIAPTPPASGFAPQSQAERNFVHTITNDTSGPLTITIPGGMARATYSILWAIETLGGGQVLPTQLSFTSKGSTSFDITASTELKIGTTIEFYLRDRA